VLDPEQRYGPVLVNAENTAVTPVASLPIN
jgi:hypothetical protein